MHYLFIFPLFSDSGKNFQQLLISNVPACWADRAINQSFISCPSVAGSSSHMHTLFFKWEPYTPTLQQQQPLQHDLSWWDTYQQKFSAARQHMGTAVCPMVMVRLWYRRIGINYEEERPNLSDIFHPNQLGSLGDKAGSQIEDKLKLICNDTAAWSVV